MGYCNGRRARNQEAPRVYCRRPAGVQVGRIARRAHAFGMSVCYHGPRQKDVTYRYYADLHEMAQAADCLIVACPETAQTRNLIDARILNALGADGFLVNVARGGSSTSRR